MSHLLFEPFTLRDVTFRNRIWVPPMCQYSVERKDGVATEWHLVHLGGMARGGAGAIIVEATGVVPGGRISPQDLGLWNDTQRDALVPIVDFLRSQGAAAGIQLAHAGRKASTWAAGGTDRTGSIPLDEGGWVTDGPSELAFPGLVTPRALEETGIREIVKAFASSAKRAMEAGFDFVEIHAAHGYLLHEFLSPLSNTRTDKYGGALLNRARFLLEVVDAVRGEIGESVPMFVRLSATDWTDDGLTLDDTVEIVNLLKQHSVDLIDVSTGANVPATIPVGPGYQVAFASGIRERTGVPTAAVGLITEPFQAEQILAAGQADAVLLGRAMLRDPHFPLRAAKALRHELPYIPGQYLRAYR